MVNLECGTCKKKLPQVCHDEASKSKLKKLINERATKEPLRGTIIRISPGICHNEVDKDSKCDGVLYACVTESTPSGFEQYMN